MVAQELQDTLRDITMMGYGLILICHSKEKASPMVDSEGNNLTSVEPDLSKNVYTICNAICDLIAYIDVEFDEHGVGKRWIYTRATPTIFAGSRWKYLDPKIPFSYEELVAAIGRAIHQAANEDGVSVAEHTETGEAMIVYRALYGNCKVYARPYDMFASEVDHEKYPKVKQKYRFQEMKIKSLNV